MDISYFQLDSSIGHRTENPCVRSSIPSLAINRFNHLLKNRLGEYLVVNRRPGAFDGHTLPASSATSDALVESDIAPSAAMSAAVFTFTFTPASTDSPSP